MGKRSYPKITAWKGEGLAAPTCFILMTTPYNNRSYYLLSTYCGQGTVQDLALVLSNLIITTTP